MKKWLAISVLTAALAAGSGPALGSDEEGCLDCHGLAGFGYLADDGYRSLEVEEEDFGSSSHNRLTCRACHREVVAVPHEAAGEKVNCGLDCHAEEAATGKPYSHEALYWGFMASIHGQAAKQPATCLDCHPHNPSPLRPKPTAVASAAACASCHGDRPSVKAFFNDSHGRFVTAGSRTAPSCPSCHTQHNVLPKDKADATVHPSKITATCAGSLLDDDGKSCHREAATAALAGMTPLAYSWKDHVLGGIFYLLGMGVLILLAIRMIIAAARKE